MLSTQTPNNRWSQNKENEMLEQTSPEVDFQTPAWGDDAPRGGKAVLNRIIKEKATVPLFFGQTPSFAQPTVLAGIAYCSRSILAGST